uniref:Uncharacterized protein n=1 Tax=Anguilla anguilla TaxID=7936 RepID=A0A0E9PSI5_ANGAN
MTPIRLNLHEDLCLWLWLRASAKCNWYMDMLLALLLNVM